MMYKYAFEKLGIKCIDIDIDFIKTGEDLSGFISDNDYAHVLSGYEKRLKESHEYIVRKLDDIEKAEKLIEDFGLIVDKDAFVERIKILKEIKDKIEKSIVTFMQLLAVKQKHCKHDYKKIGGDSHYLYYMCDKCGSQDRW